MIVVDCAACLGFVTITMLACRATMASASESTLPAYIQKRIWSTEEETVGTP